MNSPIRIGIVGGGQLGRMLTVSAKKMGFYVTVTDPTPHSPAGQIADNQIIGGYKDERTTRELAQQSDVITIDAEFVNDTILEELEKKGTPVYPSPQTIRIIKDKLTQKEFLKKNNIPISPFISVTTKADIEKAGERFGYPLLLKARFDAYDGKGNYVLKRKSDIEKGFEQLKDRELYVEQFVPFIKELAVMIARSIKGEIKIYPVVQTIHKNNVCDLVLAPAVISTKEKNQAQQVAHSVMNVMKGAGVFGIEMFLKKDHTVLVNEIAPRVHNSGHYTIEASLTSQFEQHIRAITGLPLGETDLIPKAVVMKNILGERHGDGFPNGLEKALKIKGASIHLYGKHESRIGRKMGHITVVGNSIDECLKKANRARKALII